MAQSASAKASAESRESGLVMHNKMVKYEQIISVSFRPIQPLSGMN